MAARTLQDLVSAAARLNADRPAVVYDSGAGSAPGGRASLRYRDLTELAEELARVLSERCSDITGLIGLYCREDLLVPVWILGILQSPAAYVPLDPDAPGLLSAGVVTQCGLKFCAVKTDLLQHFAAALDQYLTFEICVEWPKFKLTLVRVQTRVVPQHEPGSPRERKEVTGDAAPVVERQHPEAGDLAYVLHTSGSTGPPKTVRVPHKCILPNILHLRSLFQMSKEDVVFLASPLTFDPSVVDIFLALSSGAQLLILPALVKKTPGALARLLFRDHKATVLQVTPSLLLRFGHRTLREEVLSAGSCVRVLALGGEACPSPALLRSWKHHGNKTCIYNLYGITEVSCWACCYRVPEALLRSGPLVESSVPLGTPLQDTVLEVRDEHGWVITEGDGQAFVGGEARVCLLDGEEEAVPGTMRATGDWVTVRDKQMYYQGRRDRTVKRNGKRLNLDSVQQLILDLPQVDACSVFLHHSRLVAFVVSTSVRPDAAASDPDWSDSSPKLQEVGAGGGDVRGLILGQLRRLLPSHSVPDTLELVETLPITPHGKVDVAALTKTFERRRRTMRFGQDQAGGLRRALALLWKDTLGLPEESDVSDESNFLANGGDSLKALHFCEDLAAVVGAPSPELLQVLLDGTFSDVLRRATVLLQQRRESNPVPPLLHKRPADPADGSAKKQRVSPRTGSDIGVDEKRDSVSLSLCWSSDTGRCVDASPALLAHPRRGSVSVFIGSHSHRVQALELEGGALLWERVLGGRVEASAALSACGSLVIVGCYDKSIYFLCTATGETRWSFETGDVVKSCPAVDPLTSVVVAGSHDGHVYCLDPQLRRCLWKRHCSGGAVSASPHLRPSPRQLYAATLGGNLLRLDPDSGDVLWSRRRGAPFFSSPNCCGRSVLIGSVDGHICCFSEEGTPLWQFLTDAPVFSSPRLVPDGRRLLCGSHDGRLYCLTSADGSPVWTAQTTGRVYSSPCVFDSPLGALVALASTDGTVWILDGEDGRTLTSHALPGELFSSPAVRGRSLVIGCRDDNIYCLTLSFTDCTRESSPRRGSDISV